MDSRNGLAVLSAPSYVRLVGDHNQQEASSAQGRAGFCNSRQQFQFISARRREKLAVPQEGTVEDAVTIDKDGFRHR